MHRPYTHAQDFNVLSIPKRSLGDGHDIRVVTLLQGVEYEAIERFAGGGKVMVIPGAAHHIAGVGKMMRAGVRSDLTSAIQLPRATSRIHNSERCI